MFFKLFLRSVAILAFSLFFIVSCNSKETKIFKVGFIQLIEEEQLDIAASGVFEGLKQSGFVDGQNIKIIKKNAQGDLANISLILKTFESENIDLIITNTTPCMAAAAKLIKKIPVVFTVSFSPQDIGLANPPSNLSGYYDPYDLTSFVSLMQECIPAIKKIGLPYNSAEVNAQFAAGKIKIICKENNIEVFESPIISINDIPNAAQALAMNKIDAFVVAADNTVYAGITGLMRIAKEFNIPIFVTDPSIVKNGASIGYGIDYYDWGFQSGKLAADILSGNKKNGTLISYNAYRLAINEKSCKEQNISFPESVMNKADTIIR
ncbi:MAG TPA: ABC transporter substrate-binding protein [bacterium]|nr:ABC transporter substrate-binding protein [bacterium]